MPTKSKQELLDAVRADIARRDVCPELRATATNLVMGDGNPDADIVFIGEAPGKSEDEQGKPFVGASGKFLDEMLASVGLERNDIYITNIVKYRPPNNRDPKPEEKKAFLPFLLRQLDIIDPKVVVTLGRHSMEFFLPEHKISAIHGQPKRIKLTFSKRLVGDNGADGMQGGSEQRTEVYEQYSEGAAERPTQQTAATLDSAASSAGGQVERTIVILPLYHPAAALYNGSQRSVLMDDFSKVPQILQQLH